MDNVYLFLQVVTVVFACVATPVGLWILREFRTLHKRVDKHADEMDDHIKEGVFVHRSLERIETKLDMHLNNGGRHERGEGKR